MGAEQSVNAPQGNEAAGIGAGVLNERELVGGQYQDLASKANGIKHKLEELEKQCHSDAEVDVPGNESRSTVTSVSWSTAEKPTGAAASRPAADGLTTLSLDTKQRKAINAGARGRKGASEPAERGRSPVSSGQGSSRSNAPSWRPFGWTRSSPSSNGTPRSENSGTPRSWRSTGRGHTDPKRVYEGLAGIALHAALDQPKRLLEVLKVEPALVNSRDSDDDRTPLHWASARGNLRCTKVLIEHGADTSALDSNGDTPANLAYKCGHFALHDLLVYGPPRDDPKAIMGGMRDAMSLHCALGQHKQLRQMLSSGTAYANTNKRDGDRDRYPLHWAAARGHMKCVQMLIQHGANVAAIDANGLTAAGLALSLNHRNVHAVIIDAVNAAHDSSNSRDSTPPPTPANDALPDPKLERVVLTV